MEDIKFVVTEKHDVNNRIESILKALSATFRQSDFSWKVLKTGFLIQ